MNSETFLKLQRQYKEIDKQIQDFLISNIENDFKDYVAVIQISDIDVFDILKRDYSENGWDIKIEEVCTDYHDCEYQFKIYIRMKR